MTKYVARGALGLVTLLFVPTVALAHPQFGSAAGVAAGFAHPFTGVDHILAMIAVGIFAANLGGRALWAIPFTFMGLMAAGGALGVFGVKLPAVETIIALSVVVLGLAVAFPRKWPLAAAATLVGAFAIFHGHSHGTEIADTAAGVEYGVGFLLASGALHLFGIGLAFGIGTLVPQRAQLVGRLAGVALTVAGVGLLMTAA